MITGSRWEPNRLCSWLLARSWPLACAGSLPAAFPLGLLPQSPAPAPLPCFCCLGDTSDAFWPESPPLNKRAAVTPRELMPFLSSLFTLPSPWRPSATRPAQLGNAPPTTETKFGVRKKKEEGEGESFPKHIYIQYDHVLFPSFTEGSQESPQKRRWRMHQADGWGKLKCTCSLPWTAASWAGLGSVFLLEVKVRDWEVCGLQQEMEITFTSALCQESPSLLI